MTMSGWRKAQSQTNPYVHSSASEVLEKRKREREERVKECSEDSKLTIISESTGEELKTDSREYKLIEAEMRKSERENKQKEPEKGKRCFLGKMMEESFSKKSPLIENNKNIPQPKEVKKVGNQKTETVPRPKSNPIEPISKPNTQKDLKPHDTHQMALKMLGVISESEKNLSKQDIWMGFSDFLKTFELCSSDEINPDMIEKISHQFGEIMKVFSEDIILAQEKEINDFKNNIENYNRIILELEIHEPLMNYKSKAFFQEVIKNSSFYNNLKESYHTRVADLTKIKRKLQKVAIDFLSIRNKVMKIERLLVAITNCPISEINANAKDKL